MARNSKRRFGGWMVPTAVVAVLSGVLGSGLMVWKASEAAFSATTANPTNNWAAGSVARADDALNLAMFNAPPLTPGGTNSGSKCIVVTYSGDVAAPVKLYGAAPGGTGLAGYLRLTVEIGTGGTYSNCTGFTPGSTLYNNQLLSAWMVHIDPAIPCDIASAMSITSAPRTSTAAWMPCA